MSPQGHGIYARLAPDKPLFSLASNHLQKKALQGFK
jgi:hypothetical protein